jgi:phage shock protein PspC (stress-responsive transcriptional regulator)
MSSTDTPPPAPPAADPGPGPRVNGEEARDLSRLLRTTKASPEGRYLGGVAGGIARHFDIDPVVVRVALVVLTFFGGAGLIMYVAGWLLIPEEDSGRSTVTLDGRTRSLVLYCVAAVALVVLLGDTLGSFHFPWPLAILLVIVLFIGSRTNTIRLTYPRKPQQQAAPYGPQPFGPQPYGPQPYDASAYGSPGGTTGTASAVPPAGAAPVPVPAPFPPNPRRRGPILFWFTIALIALLEGALGIIDAAGASITGSAYPALAVGITGAMLLLGAFWGRAGGLILVGLVSTLALVASVAAQEYDGTDHRIHATPHTAADVKDAYSIDAGELVLDLTAVSDPSAMGGRTVNVKGGVGKLTVVVPDDWGIGVTARAGVGNVRVLDNGENGGFGIDYTAHQSGAADAPTIQVDAHIGVGAIEVLDETDYHPGSNR